MRIFSVPAVSQIHVLLFRANCDRNRSTVCQTQSVFLLERYLISLRFQACLYERHILVVGVWFILERQVALVAMYLLQNVVSLGLTAKEWYQKACNE